jgi:hypothetical protein
MLVEVAYVEFSVAGHERQPIVPRSGPPPNKTVMLTRRARSASRVERHRGAPRSIR